MGSLVARRAGAEWRFEVADPAHIRGTNGDAGRGELMIEVVFPPAPIPAVRLEHEHESCPLPFRQEEPGGAPDLGRRIDLHRVNVALAITGDTADVESGRRGRRVDGEQIAEVHG